jgi:cytochrome P450
MLRFLQWLLRRERLLGALRPFGHFHPFLPEHRRDPQATWRRLRAIDPVYRSRVFGTFLCTRYDEVLHVLRDPRFSADRSAIPVMRLVARLVRR